ncbi:hypothetical protein DM01DRAFT_320406 [Hesseltinella vesiculosa]|uniref:6-methylsalicylate decarboxylase n=1 Tax=Hesseltinella vesiculosa TaxID=101127 RepID=A0A1X2G8G3_9FUNG|nr:hypothetical protein DM01DRAFT_320406 [Hesseltinella vesiculosa]
MSNRLIDTHIHVITRSIELAIKEAGGDPSGYPMPTWSSATCLDILKTLGVVRAVLSVTSPGPSIARNDKQGRQLARQINEEVAAIQKKALGVVVMTSYRDKLLGDAAFKPIWEKLNYYKAIVFIHPASVDIKPKFIAGCLPQPLIDYPHNTMRTATDLLTTGRFDACPDIDIILSHGGGTLPFLGPRLLSLISIVEDLNVTSEQVERNMNRFYMDTALATAPPQLEALLAFGNADRLIFGSDFPYAPVQACVDFAHNLRQFIATNPKGSLVSETKLRQNAVQLFQKHGHQL